MTPNATSTPDASAPEPNAISTLLSAPADRRTFLARVRVDACVIRGGCGAGRLRASEQ